MVLPDLSRITRDQRFAFADQIRLASDFTLPELKYLRSTPCLDHDWVIPECQQCGVILRKHQRIGVAWAYMRGVGLLADECGTGKSPQVMGLLALMKQTGELAGSRVLLVVKAGSPLLQWRDELARVVPDIAVSMATGVRDKRIEKYLAPWEVMLIGYQMLQRDYEVFLQFNMKAIIVDDVDPLRHPRSKTAYAIKRVAEQCDRVLICNATPLQKKLPELHSVLEPVGGREVLGSPDDFDRQYVRFEWERVRTRKGDIKNEKRIVGYKNLSSFAEKVAPMVLRRRAKDLDDVSMPAVQPHNIFLDLHPEQRERYKLLQQGVLKVLKAEGKKVKRVKAWGLFSYGAMICSGLCTLGEADMPNTSSKLDWVERMVVDGDLSDEKVVVYIHHRNTVDALSSRLTRAGVGHEVVWGERGDGTRRYEAQKRFWNDPDCRVLLGTTALETGLNLQVSRHLVNLDQILNASRMQQLAGRVRRIGSSFQTVYVHNLLAEDTQEMRYIAQQSREQALVDNVWGEQGDLFPSLSAEEMLRFILR